MYISDLSRPHLLVKIFYLSVMRLFFEISLNYFTISNLLFLFNANIAAREYRVV